LLDYVPIAAAVFAVPQFLPQIAKLRSTRDTAGVSWSWGALTGVNNAAWLTYFVLSRYWTALVPSCSATLASGTLAAMLTLRGRARLRPALLIGGWAALLVGAGAVAGRAGLGTLLTAAFALQVTPSIWTAYRTERPTGIARGTWLLVLGELSCWTVFGLHKPDPRLIVLGVSGVIASSSVLARVLWSARAVDGYDPRERMPGHLREKRLAEALRAARSRRIRTHRGRRPRTPLNSTHHERERKAA
jgi:uncharacterized protein with PQ loop repeat